MSDKNPSRTPPRPPPAVEIDPRSGAAYGIEGILPIGAIVVTAGIVLRVTESGALDEVGGVPMRKSIASDPTATRRS